MKFSDLKPGMVIRATRDGGIDGDESFTCFKAGDEFTVYRSGRTALAIKCRQTDAGKVGAHMLWEDKYTEPFEPAHSGRKVGEDVQGKQDGLTDGGDK